MVRRADHYVIERELMVAFHLRSSAPYFYPDQARFWEEPGPTSTHGDVIL